MAEQFSFDGFETAATPTDRLFFAILPDTKSAAGVASLTQYLRSQYGLKGAPLQPERLHITLCFLGDFVGQPQAIMATACETASSLVRPAFDVVLDRVLSFGRATGRDNPVVLCGGDGVGALIEFRHALAVALSKKGLGRDMHTTFMPHMTLLYDNRNVAEHDVDSVSWRANEFALVRSVLGQGRHELIARWPLHD
jgi:2'-5' RNA ligase